MSTVPLRSMLGMKKAVMIALMSRATAAPIVLMKVSSQNRT